MKVIDRYMIRELLFPIIACCVMLIGLILIADLFNNLDEILKYHTPVGIIAKYYLCLVPYAFTQTIAWATWLGTIFVLVTFGFHNEIMAMKAAGLPITGIVRPVLFIGFLIGIVIFLVGDRIVPPTYRTVKEIAETYIAKKKSAGKEKAFSNVTYYSGKNQIYFFRTFLSGAQEVRDVIMLWLDAAEGEGRKKLTARSGVWEDGKWTFKDVTEHHMDSRGRILGEPRTFASKVYPEITFTPKDLVAASSSSPFLSYRELKQSIGKLKENGVNVYSENVELHARLAAPWQALVMMLMSIPFMARTSNRKLIAFNVLLCVALAFSFHVTNAVAMALGKAGKIWPFFAAWSGNMIFSLAALMGLEKANH
ncbi:MAG: LptF/LptG family permease [Candidatus Omnitrophota bacterium]|jgi:LPS export ABC transporter permease LptG